MDSEDSQTLIERTELGTCKSVTRNDFITPKLVAALSRCRLRENFEVMQDSVSVSETTISAFAFGINKFPINKS